MVKENQLMRRFVSTLPMVQPKHASQTSHMNESQENPPALPHEADSDASVDSLATDGLIAADATPLSGSAAHADADLTLLISVGRSQGYLTFDQVNDYLPDEAVDPEKIDCLLVALEEQGIELVDTPPEPRQPAAAGAATPARQRSPQPRRDEAITTAPSNAGNDPIRMYLAQMAEIPLLTRTEEISLAKRIEVTRKRFRRAILGCSYSMQ